MDWVAITTDWLFDCIFKLVRYSPKYARKIRKKSLSSKLFLDYFYVARLLRYGPYYGLFWQYWWRSVIAGLTGTSLSQYAAYCHTIEGAVAGILHRQKLWENHSKILSRSLLTTSLLHTGKNSEKKSVLFSKMSIVFSKLPS